MLTKVFTLNQKLFQRSEIEAKLSKMSEQSLDQLSDHLMGLSGG